MKHPALARVFSVVLAILSLIMLLSGGFGLRETAEEYESAQAYAQRLRNRIDTYVELDGKLSDNRSYKEAKAELEKQQKEHDEKSAKHRTELAEYSAKKGGYTMGANTINDALAEYNGIKATYDSSAAAINAAIGDCNSAAAACSAASGEVGSALQTLNGLIASMPSEPEAPPLPQEPPIPTAPTEPDPAAPEYQDDPDQLLADQQEYQAKLLEYNAAMEQYNNTDLPAYNDAMLDYNNNLLPAYSEQMRIYQGEMYNWGMSMAGFAAGLQGSAAGWAAAAQGGAAVLQSSAALLEPFSSMMPSGGSGGSMDMSSMGGLSMPDASATPQEIAGTLAGFQGALDMEASYLGKLASGLGAIGPGITKAGQQLYSAQADIWYYFEELEKDAAELDKEKERLAQERQRLDKLILSTDELRELESSHTSTRVLITNIDEIKAMVDGGGELTESAESYLSSYTQSSWHIYRGRLLICALALLAGVAGFAGIPAAFERIKKRFWLIAPVLLCLVCSCACDGINMYLGLGQMYAALFTAIFALLQLLIVLPKNKPVKSE